MKFFSYHQAFRIQATTATPRTLRMDGRMYMYMHLTLVCFSFAEGVG